MIRFSLRIPEDLHERVIARAATDRRSLNSEILHLIEVALNAAGADAGSSGGDPTPPAPLHGEPESSPT
ncbi:Arc family DNA-binding protein [Streptomyces sp. NBC_01450]|uniref:Arc family DNA-binding protein n=1 Tax=Streptomyces sp. NBC_01450 TaxID=2903871 RepID=UPI002E30B83C|nr:Arc family DNA-binding protein [Streptomyces sp. NBC_01450]